VQASPPWWVAGSAAGRAAGAPSTAAAPLTSPPCRRPAHGTSPGRPACAGTAQSPPAPLPYNSFPGDPGRGRRGETGLLGGFNQCYGSPYVFGPPGSASGSVCHKYGSGLRILSFSHKSVERTEICLQNKILIQQFFCQTFNFNIRHIFTILKLLNFIY
jgi:hypothetical protein